MIRLSLLLPLSSRPISTSVRSRLSARGLRPFSSSSLNRDSALVSPEDLDRILSESTTKVIDASWHMPNTNRNGLQEFLKGPRIPGASFFDIDVVSDQTSDLPHMLPSAEEFRKYVAYLGMSSSDDIVVYDSLGMFSAPRVWWMFKFFSHANVYVLNGGLPAWMKTGKSIDESTLEKVKDPVHRGEFQATADTHYVVGIDEMKELVSEKGAVILDARSTARFTGEAPDPRGARAGHMPGASSLPFTNVLNEDGISMKSREDLHEVFKMMKIGDKRIVSSCGSGVTACVVALALHELGHKGWQNLAIYDGSWAEWGATEGCEVVTGKEE